MNKPRKTHLRVLVCGGRDFSDYAAVKDVLDRVHRHRVITCIIHGDADGADTLGKQWGDATPDVDVEPYPADWTDLTVPHARIKRRRDGTAYNANAGFDRNQRMLRYGRPDVVVAFPGGRGTAHMVDLARRANVPVWEPLAIPA